MMQRYNNYPFAYLPPQKKTLGATYSVIIAYLCIRYSCTRETENKFSFRSFAIPLHKI